MVDMADERQLRGCFAAAAKRLGMHEVPTYSTIRKRGDADYIEVQVQLHRVADILRMTLSGRVLRNQFPGQDQRWFQVLVFDRDVESVATEESLAAWICETVDQVHVAQMRRFDE